ncbi:unnamed protein product [Rhizophagus irregularis]|uniref:Uncharacterized protein n=1 Tax=Rhizophagus irregularis TaxID=588596 RepID=A0A915YWX1_9GLOM|nr:unnamed protein product [Rhizophagus irregularis]
MITEDEWSLILDLTKVLSHFADTTDYLGGSKYCTYSSMNPTIIEIMKWIRPSSNQVKKNLYDAMIHYFNPASSEALLAALLDPHFKKLQSFTPDQKQVAENELQNKYNEIKSNQPSTASSSPPASSQRKKKITI